MNLDQSDWTILKSLLAWEGNYPRGPMRVSLTELARRTGLHKNTVRLRLLALRRGGVFEGAFFEPTPEALGLVRGGYFFREVDVPSGRALESALAGSPSVSSAVSGYRAVMIHLWEDSLDRLSRAADEIAAKLRCAAPSREYLSTDFPVGDGPDTSLSPLDRRLIVALVERPPMGLAAIGRSLRVTERTAERRARRLIESRKGYMFPRFRPAKIDGSILVGYGVLKGDDRARRSLQEAFPDRILGPMGPGMRPVVAAPMPNLQEAERRREAARGRPGIEVLETFLYQDVIYPRAFDVWIADRVGTAQGPAPK